MSRLQLGEGGAGKLWPNGQGTLGASDLATHAAQTVMPVSCIQGVWELLCLCINITCNHIFSLVASVRHTCQHDFQSVTCTCITVMCAVFRCIHL